MHIDKLGDIVNENNNTYHITIKMRLVDVTDNTYIDSMSCALVKTLMIKILSLKLMIM